MNDKFVNYFRSLSDEQKQGLADKCKTTVGYLKVSASRLQTFSPALCVKIEQATNGQVTRKDLRPDDYHLIWVELKEDAA